jgi:hypothetical protein
MTPTKLGRYEILGELERGATGRVLLAHDPEIGREVALKTVHLSSALADDERAETRARFFRDAEAAGKLQHPGIVALFDVGEADGEIYLAMEWFEANGLDAFCQPGHLLPVDAVGEMVAGVAEALGRRDDGEDRRFRAGRALRSQAGARGFGARAPGLHVPRADPRRRGGRAQRPVLAGRRALPAAHRRAAVLR